MTTRHHVCCMMCHTKAWKVVMCHRLCRAVVLAAPPVPVGMHVGLFLTVPYTPITCHTVCMRCHPNNIQAYDGWQLS
jgi:hypothetical protein